MDITRQLGIQQKRMFYDTQSNHRTNTLEILLRFLINMHNLMHLSSSLKAYLEWRTHHIYVQWEKPNNLIKELVTLK